MVKNLINGDGIRIYKVNSFTFNVHVSILGCDYLAFSIAALKKTCSLPQFRHIYFFQIWLNHVHMFLCYCMNVVFSICELVACFTRVYLIKQPSTCVIVQSVKTFVPAAKTTC